ncbi:MAG: hypothetical protein ACLGIJ_03235 [Candidatus Limnocylindria bacterium]
MSTSSLADVIDRALAGYADLTALGEEIEDEWSYVNDLAGAWTERLEAVRASRGEQAATPAEAAAVDAAVAEIGRIGDPHRAIDWLSTFPQVVLVALGERP